jgi:hypothetical protein
MSRRSWVLLSLLLLAGGLLVSCGGGGEEAQGGGDGGEMVLDAVSGGAVEASRTVTGADPFDVDVVVMKAGSGYQGYQYMVQWDPAVLVYEGQEDLKPADLNLCALPTVRENNVFGGGCARISENTNYTGPLNTLTFHCVAGGVSPLHLVGFAEDQNFGSTLMGYAGVTVETALVDASVTCQGAGQAPTAAPTTPP